MDERQKLTLGGITVEVTEVAIQHKRQESVNEYELEDGAIIRVGNPALAVYRVEGVHDNDGNPPYVVKNGTSVIVVRSPRKESNGPE